MTDQTPVFTTTRPGFMGSTEDCNQEFIKKMLGPQKIINKESTRYMYIDGDLEREVGYDIPVFLSGTITGERQDCIVWNVEGTKSYEAEITYGHKSLHEHKYAFIRFKEEGKVMGD